MGKKKLTKSQKKRIYDLYQEDGFSQQKLADLFEISQSTVHSIIEKIKYQEEIDKLEQILSQAAQKGFESAVKEKLEDKAKNKNNSDKEYHLNDSQYNQNLLE